VGLGWKPLTAECDYDAVDRRIKKEIFPEADPRRRSFRLARIIRKSQDFPGQECLQSADGHGRGNV